LVNPSEVIGKFEEAGPYDVEIAVVRAREAFFEWREQPASVRGGALANIAEDVEK
jgi:acyl-CoA reductase-like NAD-dependent aldehyde dehydrogenase